MLLENFKLKYHFIPAQKKSSFLMIVLHGKGDSLDPFLNFNKEIGLKNISYLLLNAPKKFLDGYSWYGDPPYTKMGLVKIRLILFDLINQLEQQGWKSSKIFFFGFSQGCLVSVDFALAFPKKLAGVIGISGYFYFFPRWKKRLNTKNIKTPWIFTHGTRDDVLDFEDTYFGVCKLRKVGYKVDWLPSKKGHTLPVKEYALIRQWLSRKIKNSSRTIGQHK